MHVNEEEWLEAIRREYLQTFIRDGGATVKFVVPLENIDREQLKCNLCKMAEEENYAVAVVDAAQTRSHMIDQVFFAVSRQIDWKVLASAFVRQLLSENGWSVPSEDCSLSRIAELNGRTVAIIRPELDKLLERNIFRDYHLSQEFRIAMIRLCQNQIDPAMSPVSTEAIERWLRGELKYVRDVKPAPIFQKITRHSARYMLSSLTRWLHRAGRSGLFFVLDIQRFFGSRPRPRDPDDMSIYYSRAAVLDAYEMLRELIDETDDIEHCFTAVFVAPEFVDPLSRRGVHVYNALEMRIMDEVHDERYGNPLGGLVRLAGAVGGHLSREDQA